MSKIPQAFHNGPALIAFLTAGDPALDQTAEYILTMAKAGADLIEIGIPFSDPVAEGEVIQRASRRSLQGGTTIGKIFAMVEAVRAQTSLPLVFMTYINPVFIYGYDRFLADCRRLGVDGLIIPDLPFEEKNEIAPLAAAYGVDIISLIAPTSDRRIGQIARGAQGFVYCVSSLGVTGVRSEIKTDLPAMLAAVRRETDLPAAVGFGISTPAQARAIARYADGVIVGSAIVKLIERHGAAAAGPLAAYVRSMKAALAP